MGVSGDFRKPSDAEGEWVGKAAPTEYADFAQAGFGVFIDGDFEQSESGKRCACGLTLIFIDADNQFFFDLLCFFVEILFFFFDDLELFFEQSHFLIADPVVDVVQFGVHAAAGNDGSAGPVDALTTDAYGKGGSLLSARRVDIADVGRRPCFVLCADLVCDQGGESE